MINLTTVEEVKGDQQVHETLAKLRDVQKRLSYCTGRQEIYYFFANNFNFTVISRLSKREKDFIFKIVNGKAKYSSMLYLMTPSVGARVSEYMLSFGKYIHVKFLAKEENPLL